jgi:hypothetical protein
MASGMTCPGKARAGEEGREINGQWDVLACLKCCQWGEGRAGDEETHPS